MLSQNGNKAPAAIGDLVQEWQFFLRAVISTLLVIAWMAAMQTPVFAAEDGAVP